MAEPVPRTLLALAVLPSVLCAQHQFERAGKRHLAEKPLTGPIAAAIADFDGDGSVDLVIGPAVFLNDGHARFTEHLFLTTWTIGAVRAADLDGDGDQDLLAATTELGSSFVQSYHNDGRAGFRAGSRTSIPRSPSVTLTTGVLATADVDVDGDIDAAVVDTRHGAFQIYVLVNDGTGSFAVRTGPVFAANGTMVTTLELADLDGDGAPDLIANNENLGLFRNDGTGRFVDVSATSLPSLPFHFGDVELEDIDADRDLDITVGARDRIYLLVNDGTGRFSDESAARGMTPLASPLFGTLYVDVDLDGDRDLVWEPMELAGDLQTLHNDGGGRFTPAVASPFPMTGRRAGFEAVAADLDGDGADDVLGVSPLLNDGRGRYLDGGATPFEPTARATTAPALGDVDRDGDLDLMFGGRERARLYLNDATRHYVEAPSLVPATATEALAALLVDVDRDGDLDAVLGTTGNRDLLFVNDGTGRFTDATSARLPSQSPNSAIGSWATAAADVDGDGDVDLALSSLRDVALYRNDGTGTFPAFTILPVKGGETLHFTDVDGDADPDLIVESSATQVWINDGRGGYTDQTATRVPAWRDRARDIAVGDLDGDGDIDVLELSLQFNFVLQNDGTGHFQRLSNLGPSRLAGRVALLDADEDGDLDAALTSNLDGASLFLNDGTGQFNQAVPERFGAGALTQIGLTLLVADLDGDRDPDLLAHGSAPEIWLNRHRHLGAPYLARPGRPYTLRFAARPSYGATPKAVIGAIAPDTAYVPFPGFGVWRLDPGLAVAFGPIALGATTGEAELEFTVPASAALLGRTVYGQVLVADPEGAIHLSALVGDRIR